MQKRYVFILMLFFLAFLVIMLLRAGYRNSKREEILQNAEKEIQQDEVQIAYLMLRARWGDAVSSRILLKKLHQDLKLP